MTKIEVVNFTQNEIAPRSFGGKLDDAVRDDWVRAIWKAGNLDTARQIIRSIVDDPEGKLDVRTFYKKLRETGSDKPEGKPRLAFRDGPFEVYVVRPLSDGREHRVRICYPTHRLYENGVVTEVPWTAENLMDYMQSTLRYVQQTHHKECWLEIKDRKQESAPRAVRRSTEGQAPKPELKTVPAEPPRNTTASRGELERLERAERICNPERRPLPPAPPKANAAWFDEESRKLREEEADAAAAAQAEQEPWLLGD